MNQLFAHLPGVFYPDPTETVCNHGKCKRKRAPGRRYCEHHLSLARARNQRLIARRASSPFTTCSAK